MKIVSTVHLLCVMGLFYILFLWQTNSITTEAFRFNTSVYVFISLIFIIAQNKKDKNGNI